MHTTGSSVCDPNSYYYDDSGQVVYYEQYDDEAMDVNADGPEDESLALDVQQLDWYRPDEMARDGAATAEEEEEDKRLATGGGEDETMMTPSTTTTTTLSNPIAPAGTGRRKKRRKKRNKTRSERASQPRVRVQPHYSLYSTTLLSLSTLLLLCSHPKSSLHNTHTHTL